MTQQLSHTWYTNPHEVIEQLNLPVPYLKAMARIMDALDYPVAPDGETVIDVSYVKAFAAYHLARAGFDLVNDPLIVKQPITGPGIIVGACNWVDAGEDSTPQHFPDPLGDVQNMTMAEIAALPERLQREAYRRLGLPVEDEGWHTQTQITMQDADDPEGDAP